MKIFGFDDLLLMLLFCTVKKHNKVCFRANLQKISVWDLPSEVFIRSCFSLGSFRDKRVSSFKSSMLYSQRFATVFL